MHEHIFAAIITNDEAKALLSVEEFDHAGRFADDLGGHAAPAATAAATETTAAAAAETAAITAAETATITATETAAIATAEAAAKAATAPVIKTAAAPEILRPFISEEIPLVSAAPAAITPASFIETHCPVHLPGSSFGIHEALAPDEKNAGFRALQQLHHKAV
ncbi:hypothetical protein GCM10011329_10690 [Stakelama pacifica]|nr:hypothetical protein GCM10011329_10690 [Stakelama pacifica]